MSLVVGEAMHAHLAGPIGPVSDQLRVSATRAAGGFAVTPQDLLVTFLVLEAYARKIAAFYESQRKAAAMITESVKRPQHRRRDRLANYMATRTDPVPEDPPAA